MQETGHWTTAGGRDPHRSFGLLFCCALCFLRANFVVFCACVESAMTVVKARSVFFVSRARWFSFVILFFAYIDLAGGVRSVSV